MRLAWLIPVLAIAACESAPKKTTSAVGPSGGVVKSGDASVTIPAGALTAEVTITVAASPDAPIPPGVDPVGTAIQLGPEGQAFAQPVTVRLLVDAEKLPPGRGLDQVVIMTAPVGSTSFEALVTSPDDASHVRASTTHFSVFVPVIAKPGVDLATVADMRSSGLDMSVSPDDMPGPNDMNQADAGCTRSFTPGTECTMTSSCNGKTYTMYCGNFELQGWKCYCNIGGATSNILVPFVPSTTCDSKADAEIVWSRNSTPAPGCGFPL